ncbi:hypothetical protein CR513_21194, partial [Mucuna pruriens]
MDFMKEGKKENEVRAEGQVLKNEKHSCKESSNKTCEGKNSRSCCAQPRCLGQDWTMKASFQPCTSSKIPFVLASYTPKKSLQVRFTKHWEVYLTLDPLSSKRRDVRHQKPGDMHLKQTTWKQA